MTEADVRRSLRTQVLAAAPASAEVVFEFWVPQSNERADLAVISTTMDGFEIKTERDTLKRLPRQADAYARVFDRCHAVLAQRHVDLALEILPAWWGVQVIRDGPSFLTLREAEPNDRVDPQTLVRLLWRDEAYTTLCELDTVPDPRTGRFKLWEMLLAILDLDSLRQVVRDTLLCRDAAQARIPSQRFAVT
ncbi:MAG: sce7726 family protein [Acidimicrobiales bacterium]